jgi:hypothetical protein
MVGTLSIVLYVVGMNTAQTCRVGDCGSVRLNNGCSEFA